MAHELTPLEVWQKQQRDMALAQLLAADLAARVAHCVAANAAFVKRVGG